MAKMNWPRVEKETKDRHAIEQGHEYPEDPKLRPEPGDCGPKRKLAQLKREIVELEPQLAESAHRKYLLAKIGGLKQGASILPKRKRKLSGRVIRPDRSRGQ